MVCYARNRYLLCGRADERAEVSEQGPRFSLDRFYLMPRIEIQIESLEADGWILDIGGGGEGIIGRLKGAQVVAIDPLAHELEGTPAGPLKILMDARQLQFLDETFHTVTAFFSLMYIQRADHEQVFREVWRVLAPGGRFFIWDANLTRPAAPDKDMVMIHLHVKLPNYEVLTGYGAYWPELPKDRPYYIELAQSLGFSIVGQRERAHTFFLELHKP